MAPVKTGDRSDLIYSPARRSCEKDLRLLSREFQRRAEELREERLENLSLKVIGGRGDRGGRKSELLALCLIWI